LKAGVNAEAAYQCIRARISHVSTDRVLSTDIDKMTKIMSEAAFIQFAE
jgi:histidine ammonia-lyase